MMSDECRPARPDTLPRAGGAGAPASAWSRQAHAALDAATGWLVARRLGTRMVLVLATALLLWGAILSVAARAIG